MLIFQLEKPEYLGHRHLTHTASVTIFYDKGDRQGDALLASR